MTKTASRTRAPFRALMLLPIAGLALSLAACGGADRPSAQQVADGMDKIFEESGASDLFTDDQLLCIAEKLVDSEISDQDLANIADGKDVQTSADAQKLMTEVTGEAATSCITQ